MRRFIGLLLVLLISAAPAMAQETPPTVTVTSEDDAIPGGFRADVTGGTLSKGDVMLSDRGDLVVARVSGTEAVVVPAANFQGNVHVGDTATFVHHAYPRAPKASGTVDMASYHVSVHQNRIDVTVTVQNHTGADVRNVQVTCTFGAGHTTRTIQTIGRGASATTTFACSIPHSKVPPHQDDHVVILQGGHELDLKPTFKIHFQ